MNAKVFPDFNLIETLSYVGSSPQKRKKLIHSFLKKPKHLPVLLELCFSGNPKISAKACRLLEFTCNTELSIILPYLDEFLTKIDFLKKDPEIRPAAKICELLMIAYYEEKKLETRSHLQENHREKIVETCFHWLLSDQKVAPQANSMTCLQLLGTEFRWIHPELKIILERNFNAGSAAYQARARMVLKKMER